MVSSEHGFGVDKNYDKSHKSITLFSFETALFLEFEWSCKQVKSLETRVWSCGQNKLLATLHNITHLGI